MITSRQLLEAHNIISQCVIRVIFDNEDSFKREVLNRNGWNSDDYEIERVHCANAYRITLKHYEGNLKDVYIDAQEVYCWFLSEQDKALGENK
ncbi:hypothetical protein VP14_212 [Vibrio phage VPMCC14]|nr:hypothetical protein VP14_212 [Vibrio phage VPMCC14]